MDVPTKTPDIDADNLPEGVTIGNEGDGASSEFYEKALAELMSQGMQRGKARRYLDSIAKRNLKKFMKKAKKRGATS